MLAFYSACVSFTGQCYGASKYKRIDKLFFTSVAICAGSITLITIIFTIWPEPFLRIFTDDPEVIKAGTVKLLIMSWSYILYAVSEVMIGCLRGMRKTTYSTAINIFSICGIRLLWIWFICPLSPKSASLLYLCYPVSYVFSLTALGIYMYKTLNTLKKKHPQVQPSPDIVSNG
jgi:Na+-driven multidrug efflux pump